MQDTRPRITDVPSSTAILALESVSKTFRQGEREVAALDGVTLLVRPGEFLSIVGASGCGKSTLLRVVAGLEPEYEGRAALSGEPIRAPGLDRGIVFQEHRLFPVYLNLASGIRAIDPRLVEVGRVFRLSGLALTRRVLVPAALPAYLTGLRSGPGLAWMFVVAAEIMGASRGLGYLMVDGQTTSRPDLVIAA